jgi:hypothetical protein
MCDRIAFQPAPADPPVKTAEQLYKEWWEKNKSPVKKTATTAKGPYEPRKRDVVICPVCKKQFSISAAEHRSRIKRGFKEPCCSRGCGAIQRKNNSH